MRLAPLLILLLLAPLAAAQPTTTDAGPTLHLDPGVLDVAPSSQSESKALISNPLARDLLLNLTVHSPDGVKARLDRAQVRVPAGGSVSLAVTILVPNATGVTHTVEVVAREPDAPRATVADAPVHLSAKLELRVGLPAAPPPAVDVQVRPAQIDIPSGGNATIFVFVHNGGTAPIAPILDIRLAPGLRASPQPPRDRIAPGALMEIPVLLEDDGKRPVGEVAKGSVALVAFPAQGDAFTVRTVAPPAVAADIAPPSGYLVGAAVVAGAAATWTSLWLTRRQWWPLLLALYTRLRPSKILDHPVRRRIAELVQQHPGVTFSELARLAEVAPGQLTHHARMLEKAGVVFSSPDGQTRRFFHVGAGRLASVPPLSQRALQLVGERPRRASELAKELGVSRQALHYHVKHLVAEGKLVARADGREMWLEASTPLS